MNNEDCEEIAFACLCICVGGGGGEGGAVNTLLVQHTSKGKQARKQTQTRRRTDEGRRAKGEANKVSPRRTNQPTNQQASNNKQQRR